MTTTAVQNPVPNTIKAIVRRVMPLVEGALVGAIAHFGWHPTATVVAEIVAVVATGLSIILPAAEAKFPWVGVLLGYMGAPVYAPSTKKSQATQIAALEAQLATLLAQGAEAVLPSQPTAAAPVTPVQPLPDPVAPIAPPPA